MNNKHYDIIICGGGVVGSAVAYFLSRSKDLNIALVDFKFPGNASRASAGGLWALGESTGLGCGVILFKTLSKQLRESGKKNDFTMQPHIMPDAFFDLALASNSMYPKLYQELKEHHGVDFKFEKTKLKFIFFDKYDRIYAEQIASAIPKYKEYINWIDQNELKKQEVNISKRAEGAMVFETDHQINPYRLTDAYTESARQNGVDLFLNTKITGIKKNSNTTISGVFTDKGLLSCNAIVNAGGAWAEQISLWATGMKMPVFPVKGQVVISERMPKLLDSCLTTSDCYIAQKDNGEILIGSTTEERGFDTQTDINHIKELVQGASRCVPALKEANIKRCWAGLRPGSPDELPILGPVPGIQGYFNACGHFRTGMLTSAITGQLLNELIRKQPLSLDIKPFLYERFLDHQGNMVANYHLENSL
ncbi:NAD(P)/FAD-dependent oxidoreductase [Piscirickettsia litoralis]|uniref:Hydrogen cyanide synthase n=1 Tax=Piscirickettsia litoralis TaxID=1891921 RepID=A0ABX3A4U3_9GAMM|nr:FAD-dependent oxidoreductase [Piscirickettsia litoralis]ODN42425.1 hydrogen cyanide synthase [Piscirickettsia litoralis]